MNDLLTPTEIADLLRVSRAIARSLRKQPQRLSTLDAAIVAEVERVETDVGEQRAQRVATMLTNFREWAGRITLDRIDTALLEGYQRHRLESKSVSTVNAELSAVLSMLRTAGLTVMRPRPKRGRETPGRNLTADELQRFFVACPERHRLLYALMATTGARQAELVPSRRSGHTPLLKEEVDLEAGIIHLRTAKGKLGVSAGQRNLTIAPELIDPLRRQIDVIDGPLVFGPISNGPRDFDKILRRAGIEKQDVRGKVTSHSLRHSYATIQAEAGTDPWMLKTLLGHKRLETTERYSHHAQRAEPPTIEWFPTAEVLEIERSG